MLRTKEEVVDVVSRLIWLMSVKHSAVNYPVSDYGAFTPVLPTKVYNDSSVPPGTFSVLNLPNVNISLVSKANQSINRYICRSASQSVKLINPLINKSIDEMFCLSVRPSVSQSVSQLVNQSVCTSVGTSVSQSKIQSASQ